MSKDEHSPVNIVGMIREAEILVRRGQSTSDSSLWKLFNHVCTLCRVSLPSIGVLVELCKHVKLIKDHIVSRFLKGVHAHFKRVQSSMSRVPGTPQALIVKPLTDATHDR